MKKVITLFAAVVMIASFSTSVMAQVGSTALGAKASSSATANIVTPIAITKVADLLFGNVAVDAATGGTVVLEPNGNRTVTLGVTLPATAGTHNPASFTVGGTAGYTYYVTLPIAGTNLQMTHGTSDHMTIGTFTSSHASTDNVGTQVLTVGATLNVGANQAAGMYTIDAPFYVTVNYN